MQPVSVSAVIVMPAPDPTAGETSHLLTNCSWRPYPAWNLECARILSAASLHVSDMQSNNPHSSELLMVDHLDCHYSHSSAVCRMEWNGIIGEVEAI